MGMKGKWEMSFRLLGNVLFLIGIIITVIFDFYILQNSLVYFLLVLLVGLHFSLILGLKFEMKILGNNKLIILTILTIFNVIILLLGSILSQELSKSLILFFLTISNTLGMICWDFSLSIFKKKKRVFLVGSLIYISTFLIFRFPVLMKNYFYMVSLLPIIFVIIGIVTITLAEIKLIKRKLIKFIS